MQWVLQECVASGVSILHVEHHDMSTGRIWPLNVLLRYYQYCYIAADSWASMFLKPLKNYNHSCHKRSCIIRVLVTGVVVVAQYGSWCVV